MCCRPKILLSLLWSWNANITHMIVFSQGVPLQIPWYIAAGPHDWEGNLTAEMALNGSSVSGGRWTMPDLWHTFTVTLPPFGALPRVSVMARRLVSGRELARNNSHGGGHRLQEDARSGGPWQPRLMQVCRIDSICAQHLVARPTENGTSDLLRRSVGPSSAL